MNEKEPFKIPGIPQEVIDQVRKTGQEENTKRETENKQKMESNKTPIKELLDIEAHR